MKVTIQSGHSLWEELNSVGTIISRPCNGNGTCGGCEVFVEGFGNVKSCCFREEGAFEVTLKKEENFDVLRAEACHLSCDRPMLFLDIGTTTVAGLYVDENEQRSLSFLNPQRRFGHDVITRIQAANEGEAKRMQTLIQSAVLGKLEKDCRIYISANTTMQHLFEGLSCETLGVAPFTPVTTERHAFSINKGGHTYEVIMLEGISTFVGADIVSGIRKVQMDVQDKVTLLVDLGTNGEMALGNRDKILVTSTAAGPAFESNSLAIDLHASGIISLLAYMKKNGIMDSYGTLADSYFEEGYQGMTQELIRQIQTAKGAIRAGIEVLAKEYGISLDEIEQIYLAGGMGKYIKVDEAVEIGLLPEEFEAKTQVVLNTSLLGAIEYGNRPWKRPAKVEEIVLAKNNEFANIYIERMNF